MARFPESELRLFKNKFVCRKCKRKQRASPLKVSMGKIKCRNCGSPYLRPKKKLTKAKA